MRYSMRDTASRGLASLRRGRIRVRQFLTLCALLIGLIAIALHVATSSELAAISVGNVFGAKGFSLFLLIGAAVLGLCAGIAEVARYRDLVLTLPKFPWVALIKALLSQAVRSILSLITRFTPTVLTVRIRVTQSFRTFHTLPTLTPDVWPSGPAPRVLYEPA